jgi:hypothetical protein
MLTDYLEDLEVEQTAAYARNGRSFAKMTNDELHEAWFDAMQAYASNPTSPEPRMAEANIRAEFALRGLEPPWGFVSYALAEIRSKVGKLLKSLPPRKLKEIDKKLTAGLADYLGRRARTQN